MWVAREAEELLRTTASTFPVVVLTGPRQVGKTSVVERAFPGWRTVSLDLASLAELAERQPEAFLAAYPPPLIVDEVQYAPGLFRHLKRVVEARRGETGLFVLTGSQNFALMREVADSLAGRAAVLPFLGFSGAEWRAAFPAESWRDFLWRGAFPGLWADPTRRPNRDLWYQGYVATYLERDVRNLMNVGSLRDFERFLRAAAARCGQLLNVSELGRDVGISATTARQWLSVLQASNLVLLLEPYHVSLGKRLVKSPKLYFTDAGLAAFLMGFQSADDLWASRYAGALWETHVVGQWHRWRSWHAPAAGLWFWQDRSGVEVDLLVDQNQRLTAIECKLAEHPDERDLRGVRALRGFYGPQVVTKAFVACPTEVSFPLTDGVEVRPGWTTWAL